MITLEIKVSFEIGDIVYHMCDRDYNPIMIVGYKVIRSPFSGEYLIQYVGASANDERLYDEIEISKDKPMHLL